MFCLPTYRVFIISLNCGPRCHQLVVGFLGHLSTYSSFFGVWCGFIYCLIFYVETAAFRCCCFLGMDDFGEGFLMNWCSCILGVGMGDSSALSIFRLLWGGMREESRTAVGRHLCHCWACCAGIGTLLCGCSDVIPILPTTAMNHLLKLHLCLLRPQVLCWWLNMGGGFVQVFYINVPGEVSCYDYTWMVLLVARKGLASVGFSRYSDAASVLSDHIVDILRGNRITSSGY